MTVFMVTGNEATTVPFSVGKGHNRFVRTYTAVNSMAACASAWGQALTEFKRKPPGADGASLRLARLRSNPQAQHSKGIPDAGSPLPLTCSSSKPHALLLKGSRLGASLLPTFSLGPKFSDCEKFLR